MTKEERILRFKYPDRTTFTESELKEARRLLSKDGDMDEGATRLPTRFVPVGGMVRVFDHFYKCTEAAKDILTDPCLGCDLRDLNCTSRMPQCSPFDRRDKVRVWYKLVR